MTYIQTPYLFFGISNVAVSLTLQAVNNYSLVGVGLVYSKFRCLLFTIYIYPYNKNIRFNYKLRKII